MAPADLTVAKVGDQFVRQSPLTLIRVVVSAIDGNILAVTPRPEDKEENVIHMMNGLMMYGITERSPVYMLNLVEWKYDIQTGEEIRPVPGLESILLK